MYKRKLKNHKYAKCYVNISDNGNYISFWSYSTLVIALEKRRGARFVGCTGTYSPTTRKQIGWFLREYAPDLNYYDMKNIVGKGMIEL